MAAGPRPPGILGSAAGELPQMAFRRNDGEQIISRLLPCSDAAGCTLESDFGGQGCGVLPLHHVAPNVARPSLLQVGAVAQRVQAGAADCIVSVGSALLPRPLAGCCFVPLQQEALKTSLFI